MPTVGPRGLVRVWIFGGRTWRWALVRIGILAGSLVAAWAQSRVGLGVALALWAAIVFWPDLPVAYAVASVAVLAGYAVPAWRAGVASVLAGCVLGLLDHLWRSTRPAGGHLARERRRVVRRRRRRWSSHAVQAGAFGLRVRALRPLAAPVLLGGRPVVGVWQEGNLPWPRRKFRQRRLLMEGPEVRHMVIVGASGTGKSEQVHRAAEAALMRGWQVLWVNGKEGAPGVEPAQRLARFAESLGLSARTLVRGSSPWDPFASGDPDKIADLLVGTEVYSDDHWRHTASTLVRLALLLAHRQGRPLANLPELIAALDPEDLATMAATSPDAKRVLAAFQRTDIAGSVLRWASQALSLRGWIAEAPHGFRLGEADLTAVDLPTSSAPIAARMLLRGLLTDVAQWVADPARRDLSKPCLLIVEELGAAGGDEVVSQHVINLLERGRAAGVRAVITAQDVEGLGAPRLQRALLGNSAVLAFRTPMDAEVLATLARTRWTPEASEALQGPLSTAGGEGSVRWQRQWEINPDEFRGMPDREFYVISGGAWARCTAVMSETGYGRPPAPSAEVAVREHVPVPDVPIEAPPAGWTGE